MKRKRPASFFDIDGTLIKGQIIFDFPRYLHKEGLFDEKYILEIVKIICEYEANFIPYREAGKKILDIYALALEGRKKSLIETKAKSFVALHIKKKYSYSDGLIDILKKKTVLIALSASPIEPVKALKKYIPFRHVFGTELETKNGVYTGRIKKNLLLSNAKQKAMLDIAKKLDLNLKTSYAFGDSDADIEYLAMAGHAVALNPNRHLKAIAEKNKWPMLSEKDDVSAKVSAMQAETDK